MALSYAYLKDFHNKIAHHKGCYYNPAVTRIQFSFVMNHSIVANHLHVNVNIYAYKASSTINACIVYFICMYVLYLSAWHLCYSGLAFLISIKYSTSISISNNSNQGQLQSLCRSTVNDGSTEGQTIKMFGLGVTKKCIRICILLATNMKWWKVNILNEKKIVKYNKYVDFSEWVRQTSSLQCQWKFATCHTINLQWTTDINQLTLRGSALCKYW